MVTSNILDPIHSSLSAEVWQKPDDPEPILRPTHAHFITSHIYKVLEHGGYHNPHRWLKLFLTGSLCTYQYSHESDADVSLFVDSKNLPEWSRAEMIGLMIDGCDGATLPGTPYELQAYVVARGIHPTDLYQPHLRPGYDIAAHHWISPPDQSLARDTKTQKNGFYAWALQGADKMERLLRYEPDKAADYWHQIHRKRMRDQASGKGDYSESNILYKFLFKRGLMPQLAELTGEHISMYKQSDGIFETSPDKFAEALQAATQHAPRAAFISPVHDPSALEAHRLFLDQNGLAGASVSPNGELSHLFRHPEAPPGTAKPIINAAINAGANWLNAYDNPNLINYYRQFGFTEQGRNRWDDQYAPPNWNYDHHGRPDVVFMARNIPENTGQYYDTWDEAEAAARREPVLT